MDEFDAYSIDMFLFDRWLDQYILWHFIDRVVRESMRELPQHEGWDQERATRLRIDDLFFRALRQ